MSKLQPAVYLITSLVFQMDPYLFSERSFSVLTKERVGDLPRAALPSSHQFSNNLKSRSVIFANLSGHSTSGNQITPNACIGKPPSCPDSAGQAQNDFCASSRQVPGGNIAACCRGTAGPVVAQLRAWNVHLD